MRWAFGLVCLVSSISYLRGLPVVPFCLFALVWGVLLKQECRRKGTFAFEGLLRNRVYVPTEDCHVEHDDLAKGPLLRMAKIRVWGFGVRV